MSNFEYKYFKYKTKYLKLNNMYGGNIEIFFKKYIKKSDDLKEIGKGDGGIVYIDIKNPLSVYKISKKSNKCRIFNSEKNIYDNLNKHEIDTDLCKLMKMKNFNNKTYNEDTFCILELIRVINPINSQHYFTIHPTFSEQNRIESHPGRGIFLGLFELNKFGIIKNIDLEEYISQLGEIIGKLHFKVKCDTHDMEIFIGREPITKKIILYLSDFDLSKMYINSNDLKDEDINKMSALFTEYIPTNEDIYDTSKSNPKLRKVFLDSYYKEAIINNEIDLANKIVNNYDNIVKYWY